MCTLMSPAMSHIYSRMSEQNQVPTSRTRHEGVHTEDPSASAHYSGLSSCLITPCILPIIHTQVIPVIIVMSSEDVYLLLSFGRSVCLLRVFTLCIPSLACVLVVTLSVESLLIPCGFSSVLSLVSCMLL